MLQHLRDPVYVCRPQQILARICHFFRESEGQQVADLPWDGRLTVFGGEKDGRAVLRRGLTQLKVTEACFRLSKPGTLALDIGANVGQMTSALVHAMETGRVRAFEPHPEIFPVLEENVSRLRSEVPGVTIEASKMAVAQESGSRTLYIPDRWSHNHGVATLREMKGADRVRVKVCTLDREVTSEIHLMKVDVEEKFEGLIKGGYKKLEKEG